MILKEFLMTMNFRKCTEEDYYDTEVIRIRLPNSIASSPYFELGIDDWADEGKASVLEAVINSTILETEIASFDCHNGYIRVFLEDDDEDDESEEDDRYNY